MDEDPRRVRLVRQREEWDCGVAALSMTLGLSYDQVYDALAPDLLGVASRHGLVLEQLVTIAAALGRSLRPVQAVDGRVTLAADRPGIIGLLFDAGLASERAHWAVLHQGHIFCPAAGAITPIADYAHHAEAFALLVAA
jgi:ABC-type bacteriocin/lantibiotic exporter with double-glycine peptidase domain